MSCPTRTNLAPAPALDKANCAGNCAGADPRTEELRRVLQASLSYGADAWLSRESGICLSSVRKAIEGEQRLPAALLRAALRLRAPDEVAALLSLWTGIPLVHRP